MKAFNIFFITLCISFAAFAQNGNTVNVNNETGLVSINGKAAFYMDAKSSVPWETDYAVENTIHKQLAYFKLTKGYRYSTNQHNHDQVQYYKLTFTHSGAHCNIWDYMTSKTIIRSLAMILVDAHLVKNGTIDTVQEKDFIAEHGGFMTPEAADTTAKDKIPTSAAGNDTVVNGNIILRDNFIYYSDEIAGTYNEVAIDTDMLLVNVYSVNRNKVAEVTYVKGEDDWRVITLVDQNKVSVSYNKETPLEELFRYLLRKRYL